jgi:carbon monoxide dehydrogenase subunit G
MPNVLSMNGDHTSICRYVCYNHEKFSWRFYRLIVMYFVALALFLPSDAQPSSASDDSTREISRLFSIDLSKLPDGVTSMKSTIYIDAPPLVVWKVLTDYNNLKRYIPRVTESDLVEDRGNLKVIALTGEFRVLLFKKTIHLTINMHETFPGRIDYEKTAGDFEVYRGFWTFEQHPSGKGTILTYVCEIKPSFIAPEFIFQGILKKDVAGGLSALRDEAETMQPK